MPLWKKGEHTIKQPVFVSDLAQGIIQAIKEHDAVGQTYQAVGYIDLLLCFNSSKCIHNTKCAIADSLSMCIMLRYLIQSKS